MENNGLNPYQIFAEKSLPTNWDDIFNQHLNDWPQALRPALEQAWKNAKVTNFPDRKDESWRWMDFRAMRLDALQVVHQANQVEKELLFYSDEDTELSTTPALPEGVLFTSLKELLAHKPQLAEKLLSVNMPAKDGKFASLATALASDGLVIYLPKNVELEGVYQVKLKLNLENKAFFSRSVIWLEEGASAKIELEFSTETGQSEGFHNGVTNVIVGPNARLHLDQKQLFSSGTWNITHEVARLEQDANLDWNYSVLDAKMSKNFVRTDLFGKGSQANMTGIMFPENSQVVNIETRQNHWVPSTTSDLLYKTAVAQDGRSIWHGMIYVDPQAQQTDAYQSNRNLVLDDSADVKSIPGLEIHADDVKCSHGATVGRIDSEELFYLKARGIPEKEAEKLIIEGFFNQILNNFSLEKTRVEMRERLIERISI